MVLKAAFGWLVPGGTYLLDRRYVQFAGFALVVSAAFAAGLVMGGGVAWPRPGELAGLDGFTSLAFQAGAFSKVLSGGPWLVARLFEGPGFLDGRMHEYGTTLLMMAGLLNVLAVSSAFDLGREEKR
jgi:hypothetical protein